MRTLVIIRQVDTRDFMADGTTKPAGTNDLETRLSPNNSKIIFTNRSNTGTGEATVMTIDFDGKTAQRNNYLMISQLMQAKIGSTERRD